MKISIITASTARPKQFALLQEVVNKQTLIPDEWICVGENHDNYKKKCDFLTLIERDNSKDDPGRGHSMTYNLMAALEACQGDYIHIIEDSDWYSKDYLQRMSEALADGASLAGISFEIYYYLRDKKVEFISNATHCTLATSSFDRKVWPHVIHQCQRGNPYIDSKIWSITKRKTQIHNFRLSVPAHYHIGFKQGGELPGITKHEPKMSAEFDKDFAWLIKAIGRDTAFGYMGLVAPPS